MVLYTTDGCAYFGMDETTVTALRTELGKSTTFTDQATYEALVASWQEE